MDPDHFIADWLASLDGSQADAARRHWHEIHQRLIQWAGTLTSQTAHQGHVRMNPESIVSSVFGSLVRGTREGRLQSVRDFDELWWLLLSMTRRKVADRVRYATAQKRNNGKAELSLSDSLTPTEELSELASTISSPEYVVVMQEEFEERLASLNDPFLQQIAVLRMEGYTTQEIADRLNRAKSTVDRKLKLIRELWSGGQEPDE